MARFSARRLLAREPALIMWALFLISTPFYVLNAGMPQPNNLLIFALLPKAMRWKRGWHPSLTYTLRPLKHFIVWAIIVNYGWAIANWKLDYKEYGLFPIYFLFNYFLLFIALLCPNTLDILAPYEPALGWKTQPNRPAFLNFKIPAWGPSLPWAVAVSIVAAVAIFSTGGPSEFLYWQF